MTAASLNKLASHILAWVAPALLTAAVTFLWGIQQELRRISESLAVAMVKIQDHDRRLDNVETFLFKATQTAPRP